MIVSYKCTDPKLIVAYRGGLVIGIGVRPLLDGQIKDQQKRFHVHAITRGPLELLKCRRLQASIGAYSAPHNAVADGVVGNKGPVRTSLCLPSPH